MKGHVKTMGYNECGVFFRSPICGVGCTPMSTAIVREYTAEGFVIAADGRKSKPDGTVVSDTVQKIFPHVGPGRVLAYSLAGTVMFTADHDENDIVFDFVAQTAEVAKSLSAIRSKNLVGFGKRLGDAINRRLADAKGRNLFSQYTTCENSPIERGYTIARIFVDGYCDGIPSRINIRFFHENQILRTPDVLTSDLNQGWMYGSKDIADLLFATDDQRLAAYRIPKARTNFSTGPPTLRDAIEYAKSYIRACSDPVALQIDPKSCSAIGGHIHIASVTTDGGFQWWPDYEPRDPAG